MSAAAPENKRSNAYELFILLLTLLSLAIMVALVLPILSPATTALLQVYDNVICVVFLFDFGLRMRRAPSKRGYFIAGRGWLDLLGSVPSFGFFKYTALLRLARISRLARIARTMKKQNRRELLRDMVQNRGEYAVFITLIAALFVLTVSSVLMVQVESKAADANITTGGTSLWWAVVTITTVGYGDAYPVTTAGRIIAVFVMFSGVGIIAALASILASVLIPTPKPPDPETVAEGLRREFDQLHEELRALRGAIETGENAPPP